MFSKSHQSVTGTILVADDQVANRELLEELLKGLKSSLFPTAKRLFRS
jgi:CheY-like chemotaxis protein